MPSELRDLAIMLAATGAGILLLDFIGRTFSSMHGPTRREQAIYGDVPAVPEGMKAATGKPKGRGGLRQGGQRPSDTPTIQHSTSSVRTSERGGK